MQNRIHKLEKESRDVDEQCEQMEDYIERVQRESEEERKSLNKDHDQTKLEMRQAVVKLKFDLDKVLSLKINI